MISTFSFWVELNLPAAQNFQPFLAFYPFWAANNSLIILSLGFIICPDYSGVFYYFSSELSSLIYFLLEAHSVHFSSKSTHLPHTFFNHSQPIIHSEQPITHLEYPSWDLTSVRITPVRFTIFYPSCQVSSMFYLRLILIFSLYFFHFASDSSNVQSIISAQISSSFY